MMKQLLLYAFLSLNITATITALVDNNVAKELLHQAIISDSVEKINNAVLLGASISQGKDGKCPLILAVLLNKNQAVEALLNIGSNANTNYLGQNLVKHAVKLGHIKAATLLVKYGADFSGSMDVGSVFSFHSQNIVSYIFNRFHITPEVLKLLQEIINHDFDLNSNAFLNSYWIAALPKANKDVLNFLIKNGANINHKFLDDTQEWTPLLYAVYMGNHERVRLLLEAGADVNQVGRPLWWGNQTPLSVAVKMGNAPMVEILLEHGAQ